MKSIYHAAVLTDKGTPIQATIAVYNAGTMDLATIYSDYSGTPKDNPFQTNALGRLIFFANSGFYDIKVSGAGITTYVIEGVLITRDIPGIDVREAGAKSGYDSTEAFQAVLTEIASQTYPHKMIIPPGLFIITDTLEGKSGTIIDGYNKAIYSNFQSGIDDRPISLISFEPTSEKDLFYFHETNPVAGNYASNIRLSNLAIKGNSIGNGNYSRYALNLEMVANSIFKNVGISQFQIGHYANGNMNNRFNGVHISKCINECFHYDTEGDEPLSTSDIWDGCIFRETPLGGLIKMGYGIRFIAPLFESLGAGVDMYRECAEIEFIAPYVENVPTLDNYFVYRFGINGSATWPGNNLTLKGGFYQGRADSFGGKTGDWLAVKYCSGIQIHGGHIQKYNNGIRSDDMAATPNNSIYLSGPAFQDVTNLYDSVTGKIWGHYPTGNLDGAINPKVYGYNIQMIGLPIYANNAAAIIGGLGVGDFYRTNADPDIICVVH